MQAHNNRDRPLFTNSFRSKISSSTCSYTEQSNFLKYSVEFTWPGLHQIRKSRVRSDWDVLGCLPDTGSMVYNIPIWCIMRSLTVMLVTLRWWRKLFRVNFYPMCKFQLKRSKNSKYTLCSTFHLKIMLRIKIQYITNDCNFRRFCIFSW